MSGKKYEKPIYYPTFVAYKFILNKTNIYYYD
jgi:hypothetical protein